MLTFYVNLSAIKLFYLTITYKILIAYDEINIILNVSTERIQ